MTECNETTVEYWNEVICNDSLGKGDSPEQFVADCQSLISMLEAHIDSAKAETLRRGYGTKSEPARRKVKVQVAWRLQTTVEVEVPYAGGVYPHDGNENVESLRDWYIENQSEIESEAREDCGDLNYAEFIESWVHRVEDVETGEEVWGQ